MPQVSDPNDRRCDPKKPTGAKLETSELDDFLRFLLFDVARRPAALKIRECMRVARYLDRLATDGVPKEMLPTGRSAEEPHPRRLSAEERDKKWCAQQIADVLWTRVRTLNSHDAASNRGTLRFLESHAETHFANPFIRRTMDLVKDFDVPVKDMRARPKPNLVSASMTAYGGDPRRPDDLSERLFVADHVLKGARLPRRREKIVEVLNKSGVQTRRRLGRDPTEQEWLPEEVRERVKAFEKHVQHQLTKEGSPGNLKEFVKTARERMAVKWIEAYRWDREAESMAKIQPQP
jgi:hypothetical protein